MKSTPDNITQLGPNEIFVFGSNLSGRHGKGAARTAFKLFGAVERDDRRQVGDLFQGNHQSGPVSGTSSLPGGRPGS